MNKRNANTALIFIFQTFTINSNLKALPIDLDFKNFA